MSDLSKHLVKFTINGVGEAEGELIRIKAPHTVQETWYALPLSGRAMIYENAGIYFLVNYQIKQEKAVKKVGPGDIAYCPMGKAIYVFWQEAETYSEVNIIGQITKNLEMFPQVKKLARVVMDKLE